MASQQVQQRQQHHHPPPPHSPEWTYPATNAHESLQNSILRSALVHNNTVASNADLTAIMQRSQWNLGQQQNPPPASFTAQNQAPLYSPTSDAHQARARQAYTYDAPPPPIAARRPDPAVDQHNGNARKNSTTVRRRTSRACDQCNQLRTKCDGKQPCGHCVETRLTCEYARMRKKRGKASKKDLAEQAAAAAAAQASGIKEGSPAQSNNTGTTSTDGAQSSTPDGREGTARPSMTGRSKSMPETDTGPEDSPTQPSSASNLDSIRELPDGGTNHSMARSAMLGGIEPPYHQGVDMHEYHGMPGQNGNPIPDQRHRLDSMNSQGGRINTMDLHQAYDLGVSGMHDQTLILDPFNFPMDSPSTALMMEGLPGGPGSPGAMSVGSTSITSATSQPIPGLKYPVLLPLLPHIKNIMPQNLAFDLLEHYFASSSATHPHPQSPYLLAFIFSKKSFLRTTRARDCSPALLASMLWIAARTSDARPLTSPPSARGRLCQKLLNLTVSLLKPLIHGHVAGKLSNDYPGRLIINGSALGGAGITVDHLTPEKIAAGNLDDVCTYMHLAIVISASEDKGASLRWWTAAWALAKELRLGREVPVNIPSPSEDGLHADDETNTMRDSEDPMDLDNPTQKPMSEEEREERRRIWWLLYIVDRHLALCYNRPLQLLDSECESLLRPMDERAWQAGIFHNSSDRVTGGASGQADGSMPPYSPGGYRATQSRFEFTGPSIFGCFLPLMAMLGEIVDLHHSRQHALLRFAPRDLANWDNQVQHIVTQQLEAYERSMQAYASQQLPPVATVVPGGFADPAAASAAAAASTTAAHPPLTEAQIHVKIAIAYSTHIMHVLHILLTGQWDPISLLDDNDLWISSPSFVTAIGHAVSGAEAVTDILGFDPELNFMPFLYGIYLLQGSFLLLLIADKLQGDASPGVVRACETIVRAHEACFVTLNTEYQVSTGCRAYL
jgi:hypothetical protein